MKEEKLRKMKEGKERKKNLKNKTTNNDDEVTQKPEIPSSQDSKLSTSEVNPENLTVSSMRIVFKDGKPVIENSQEFSTQLSYPENELTLVHEPNYKKLSSMSFRKKNHTKQWTEEETKKFYKVKTNK